MAYLGGHRILEEEEEEGEREVFHMESRSSAPVSIASVNLQVYTLSHLIFNSE